MTLIAYKDGIACADSCVTASSVVTGYHRKIWRNSDGALFMGAGPAIDIHNYASWFLGASSYCEPYPDRIIGDDAAAMAIFFPDGSLIRWSDYQRPERGRSSSIGFGYFAYIKGALDAGLSAIDAVKLASRNVFGTSGPLIVCKHSTADIHRINLCKDHEMIEIIDPLTCKPVEFASQETINGGA